MGKGQRRSKEDLVKRGKEIKEGRSRPETVAEAAGGRTAGGRPEACRRPGGRREAGRRPVMHMSMYGHAHMSQTSSANGGEMRKWDLQDCGMGWCWE